MAEDKATSTRRGEGRHTLFASVAVFNDSKGTLLGYLNDLSTTGLGLTVAEPMPLYETLSLRLELPEEMKFGTRITVDGQGAWCVPADFDNMYHCGVRFTNPSSDLSAKLFEVIRYFGQ